MCLRADWPAARCWLGPFRARPAGAVARQRALAFFSERDAPAGLPRRRQLGIRLPDGRGGDKRHARNAAARPRQNQGASALARRAVRGLMLRGNGCNSSSAGSGFEPRRLPGSPRSPICRRDASPAGKEDKRTREDDRLRAHVRRKKEKARAEVIKGRRRRVSSPLEWKKY